MDALSSKLGGSNYNHYRFHETTSASNLVGTSQEDDGARLRCHTCNVVRELFWDKATKMFQLRVPGIKFKNMPSILALNTVELELITVNPKTNMSF